MGAASILPFSSSAFLGKKPGKPQEDDSAMGVQRTPDVVEGET